MRVAAIKSASTIRKISSFSMSVVSAGREELDLADLLACGTMCSSVLVCNTAVQCPKYTANAYRQMTDKLMFKSVVSTVR